MQETKEIKEIDCLYFACPHCHVELIVGKNDINCRIFRHAVYKSSMIPINPHASKVECDYLLENDLVFGCAKPFKLEPKDDSSYTIEKCDYV